MERDGILAGILLVRKRGELYGSYSPPCLWFPEKYSNYEPYSGCSLFGGIAVSFPLTPQLPTCWGYQSHSRVLDLDNQVQGLKA